MFAFNFFVNFSLKNMLPLKHVESKASLPSQDSTRYLNYLDIKTVNLSDTAWLGDLTLLIFAE
jgi:hypothetical protein